GTGGTIRTLAKMDRRHRKYPLDRLHGYTIAREGIDRIVEQVSAVSQEDRSSLPGLSEHRADSIVGGALAVQLVMEMLGASKLSVAGFGLREGIALALLGDDAGSVAEVRAASLAALVSRFVAWDAARAVRRAEAASSILDAVTTEPDRSLSGLIWNVAYLLDIGRALDYFNRLSHTATILQVADLYGYEHREIAMMTAIVRGIERKVPDLSGYAPLLDDADYPAIELAAATLALADEIERRSPPGPVPLAIERTGNDVEITVHGLQPVRAGKLGHRLSKVLDRKVSIGGELGD
ncbi:MAG TPA: hypothetical protein VKU87_03260, partial [Thermomicrobiaceae bacterium]|nr:hypothetical protein [Thermomicrobiaceae bacterium]